MPRLFGMLHCELQQEVFLGGERSRGWERNVAHEGGPFSPARAVCGESRMRMSYRRRCGSHRCGRCRSTGGRSRWGGLGMWCGCRRMQEECDREGRCTCGRRCEQPQTLLGRRGFGGMRDDAGAQRWVRLCGGVARERFVYQGVEIAIIVHGGSPVPGPVFVSATRGRGGCACARCLRGCRARRRSVRRSSLLLKRARAVGGVLRGGRRSCDGCDGRRSARRLLLPANDLLL